MWQALETESFRFPSNMEKRIEHMGASPEDRTMLSLRLICILKESR